MKNLTLLLLTFAVSALSVFSSTAVNAKANGVKYSRILSEDVVLYMDSSLTVPWFTLPYGYYVKVLSVSGTSAKVEYRGDNPLKPSAKGYVGADELHLENETPSVLYPSLTLTVNQTCLLYKDNDFTITETVTQNSTADFYGILTRPNGEKYVYCFVNTTSGDKYLGYMSIKSFFSFSIPRLELPSDNAQTDEPPSGNDTTYQQTPPLGSSVQFVVIIAVSAVAISIVYLLFKPSGKNRAKDEAITYNEFDDN